MSRRLPRVSVICPNVSGNALGRALVLAELLRSEYDVRIVGMQRGQGPWLPAERLSIPLISRALPTAYARDAILWMREVVEDDVLVVSKTLPQSLGFALVARRGPRRMVIDIDDWESGFFQLGATSVGTGSASRLRSYLRRGGANLFVAVRALEEIAKRIPHRLTSNTWLHRRFGGDILYHVRDHNVLDPKIARALPGVDLPRDRMWVGFVGTPRTHKGLGVLVDALSSIQGVDAPGLVVMGASMGDDPSLERAARLFASTRFRLLPPFPFEALRDHLALVDVVAVPSLDVPAARGQIPAKVFDGLAMAKPIIASDLNDMRTIADGCGITVPPGDVLSVAAAVRRLAADPELRLVLGRAGRQKLIQQFSYDAGRPILLSAVRAAAR